MASSSCTWNDDHYGNAKGKKYHKSDDNEDEDEDDNQVVFRNHDKEERMKDVQAYHEPRRGKGVVSRDGSSMTIYFDDALLLNTTTAVPVMLFPNSVIHNDAYLVFRALCRISTCHLVEDAVSVLTTSSLQDKCKYKRHVTSPYINKYIWGASLFCASRIRVCRGAKDAAAVTQVRLHHYDGIHARQ